MEYEASKILSKIISREELDKIPIETADKIDKYFEQHFEETFREKATHETAERTWRK